MSRKIATSIVQTLFDRGFVAYFAGGWVRDHLLGKDSPDIDIATNAPPEEVISLFPKTIEVGVSFGVVVVVIKGQNFEVTTFRKDLPYLDGRHPSGVDYSTAEKDAQRRDFTINGMFFDPLTEEIHDYVGGREDLERGIIRAIGNAEERFAEDKLRMLRAVRFSTRFRFPIEEKTWEAIKKQASTLLPAVSMERITQELTKMWEGDFENSLRLLEELGLLKVIFPDHQGSKISSPYVDSSMILSLLELFPQYGKEERIALCKKLKLSNRDVRLVIFYSEAERLFKNGGDLTQWVYFYAHPDSDLMLRIQGMKSLSSEFHEEHFLRQKRLAPHIERVKKNQPLLCASDLQKEGIAAGPQMGLLLKEGERIAIEHDLRTAQEVIARLKKTSLWT